MSRFYFNIVMGPVTVIDTEGTELEGLAQARDEAVMDARALMSDAILAGDDISGRRIDVCNDAGDVLLAVPFADTVKRRI